MANYPHPQKGEHKHSAGTQFRYTINQDMAADRQVQAQVRKGLADARPAAEQLRRLDERLGTGLGAAKERIRLQRIIGARPEGIAAPVKAPPAAPAPSRSAPKGKKARKAAQAAAKA